MLKGRKYMIYYDEQAISWRFKSPKTLLLKNHLDHCCVVLRCVVLRCGVAWCSVVLCCVVLFMLCNLHYLCYVVIDCCVCYVMLLCCVVLCCAVLCCVICVISVIYVMLWLILWKGNPPVTDRFPSQMAIHVITPSWYPFTFASLYCDWRYGYGTSFSVLIVTQPTPNYHYNDYVLRLGNLGPVSLRLMTSQFKDIVTLAQKSKTAKCIFCGVWVHNFAWNFKCALWNFSQNFEPIPRKICILRGVKNLTTYNILELWHLKS